MDRLPTELRTEPEKVFNNLNYFSSSAAIISDNGLVTSYEQLLKIADGFGNAVSKSSIVLLVCENCIESIASYLGFIRFGIVPILIDNKTNIDFVKSIQQNYKVKYICAQETYLEFYFADYKQNHNIVYSNGSYKIAEFCRIENNRLVHSDLALLLPTSGSTGSPKFVRISYKNLYSNTKSISKSLPIESTDRVITTMPMSYSYGLSIINTHLFNGASIHVTNKSFMEKEFWSVFSKAKITTFGGVPFIYEMLKRLNFSEMEFDSLKYITQAGGKLSSSLIEYFLTSCKKMGVDFYIMYGQTEATARMSVLSSSDIGNKKTSIGKAIPEGDFSLIDEEGNIINNDIPGELVYFGNNVSMGYAENYSDLTLGDTNKGKLYTGDIAKRDSDGFYYIVGRKNRFVKIFGVRVGLDDVENFLNSKGIESACSGSDNKLKIYTSNPNSISKIKEIVTENRLFHHKGYSIHLINSIPRNKSGKIIYSQL